MDRNDDFSTADGAPPTYERLNADHGSEANGDARPMEPSVSSANVTPPGEPGTQPPPRSVVPPTDVVEVKELRIADLDRSIHARAKLDLDHVDQFAKLLTDNHDLPPVDVIWELITQRYYLAGGYHRTAAHEKLGREKVLARVQVGTRRGAILFGIGQDQNKSRSNADKRKSVELLLGDPEWRMWSNVVIGRRCGVDDKTVASVREQLGYGADRTRRTSKGQEMNTVGIVRKKKTSENPRSATTKPHEHPTQTESGGASQAKRTTEYRPPACPSGWSWLVEDGCLVGIAKLGAEIDVHPDANARGTLSYAGCSLDSLDFLDACEPSASAIAYLSGIAPGIEKVLTVRLTPGAKATDVFPSVDGVPICIALKGSRASGTKVLETLGYSRVADGEKPIPFADVVVLYGDQTDISHVAMATTGTPRRLKSIVSVAPETDGELVTHSKGSPLEIWARKPSSTGAS